MQRALPTVQALAAALLAGCSSLLPHADVATQQAWASFADARSAIERVVPQETTRADLSAAGIDPLSNAAVTILGFPDVMQRFASGNVLDPRELDPGIRECLAAGNACTGYALQVRRSDRKRIGNFWADTFNFRRETDVTGWNFNALLLLVGDVVVYKVHGGQPLIHEKEVSRNPLGPLQGLGEAAGSALSR